MGGVFGEYASAKALPLNETIPPNNTYAVSVSMPTWENVETYVHRGVGYELICHGYPRIFIHSVVLELGTKVASLLGSIGARCLPFPSIRTATRCVSYVQSMDSAAVLNLWRFGSRVTSAVASRYRDFASFYAVLVPENLFKHVVTYWRHSGDGLSPRYATHLMQIFDTLEPLPCTKLLLCPSERLQFKSNCDEFYAVTNFIAQTASRNAKVTINANNVFLYPTGMCAIFAAARAIENVVLMDRQSNFVVFGFPYTDTLKMLEKLCKPNCLFYPRGSTEELDELEALLKSGTKVQGFFCEFPTNPLLCTPDLVRIRSLADQYSFVVACDDTIASFGNVDLFPFVDVIMTSLTKFISGVGNVMGGSAIINPKSEYCNILQDALVADHEDIWFPDDAYQMSINCKSFMSRLVCVNQTASSFATWLQQDPLIESVLYPSLSASKSNYDKCLKKGGGYGFLMSLIFHRNDAATAFYDALDVPKGPSLGFNFTLATPYTLFGHHDELEWAAQHDVPEHLVRISFGLEPEENLWPIFARALEEARRVCNLTKSPNAQGTGRN